MASRWNVMIKINQLKKKAGSCNVNSHKKVHVRERSQSKRKGKRVSPINHDMRAMIACNIGGRRNKKGPQGVV